MKNRILDIVANDIIELKRTETYKNIDVLEECIKAVMEAEEVFGKHYSLEIICGDAIVKAMNRCNN